MAQTDSINWRTITPALIAPLRSTWQVSPTSNRSPAAIVMPAYARQTAQCGVGATTNTTHWGRLLPLRPAQTSPVVRRRFSYREPSATTWPKSLAIQNDGTVWAWGVNNYGQLGDGGTAKRNYATPTLFPTSVEACAGQAHSCTLTASGDVYCSGAGYYGQLGNGETARHLTPVASLLPLPAKSLSCRDLATCATLLDDTLWCFGRENNSPYGEELCFGSGCNTTPTEIPIGPVSDVMSGNDHICVSKADEAVWCWGKNTSGQAGSGSTNMTAVAEQVLLFDNCGDGLCDFGESSTACPADCTP